MEHNSYFWSIERVWFFQVLYDISHSFLAFVHKVILALVYTVHIENMIAIFFQVSLQFFMHLMSFPQFTPTFKDFFHQFSSLPIKSKKFFDTCMYSKLFNIAHYWNRDTKAFGDGHQPFQGVVFGDNNFSGVLKQLSNLYHLESIKFLILQLFQVMWALPFYQKWVYFLIHEI